ncbi:hypothetical protein M430DRAFT_21456 [Amorphotheca resinae ATCC 22711]|uniref:Uncharacterized protein n=1 Tax=Amorphotheca resinae ATCC 22711 TaxID=857342 RepID=A0A2T3AUQ0_AMORE|nr:hypothetical protein M430DRAFT_21456 [Amorphotheca resinae ATCC 22711]PSS12362.1 hypothetical protein M430DRAFT_21456 [Amorphotheca resinae ATCC 22711]
MNAYDSAVASIAASKLPFRIYHSSTNSTRKSQYERSLMVDTSELAKELLGLLFFWKFQLVDRCKRERLPEKQQQQRAPTTDGHAPRDFLFFRYDRGGFCVARYAYKYFVLDRIA